MRAYAIHRPLGMGTYPSEYRDKITELHNYEFMQWVDEINHNAFGYIEFEDGSIPKEALYRYDLWTDPRKDEKLVAAGKALARSAKNEDWDRFEHVWDKAKEKYGYSDSQLERAMGWFEENDQQ